MRWSGETLAGQERRYRAQEIAGIGDDIQNHSVKKKGKVVLKAVVVLGMSYLPTPQNSSTVGEAMELKRTYFAPYRKSNKRCGFYEWMHEDLRQEFRICYTKKIQKNGNAAE